MAFNYYIASSCNSTTVLEIKSEDNLIEGKIYDLIIPGANGCYSIAFGSETPLAYTATIFNGPWNSCVECLGEPTQTQTPTNTASQTQTPTPSVTTTQTSTPTQTASNTPTPSITASPTGTAAVTPTPTGTPASTPTQTPTPTVTFNYTIYVNEQYEYTLGMLGSFSGGTAPSGSTVPYQVMTDENGNVTVVQLNAISLGGFQGLNN